MLRALAMASRPKTLVASFVPVALSYFLSKKLFLSLAGFHWFLIVLISSFLIQIATNFFNDAIDYEKGADTSTRLGPKRAVAEQKLSPRQMKLAALVALGLAFVVAVPLIYKFGSIILLVGIVSMFMAYAYTGGPLPLAYNGLGEAFVLIFFGWIACLFSGYVFTFSYSWEFFLLGSQVGLLSCALIAVNNLRDLVEDKKISKNTLAVIIGRVAFLKITSLFYFLPALLSVVWVYVDSSLIFLCVLQCLYLPLAFYGFQKLYKNDASEYYNKLLSLTALQLVVFSLLTMLGLLLT